MSQRNQSARYNASQAAAAKKLHTYRIERQLTAQEVARIRWLWGCADFRVSQDEIARMMGVSRYAVQQALAGKTPSIYQGKSSIDPIHFARVNNRASVAVQRVMESPR